MLAVPVIVAGPFGAGQSRVIEAVLVGAEHPLVPGTRCVAEGAGGRIGFAHPESGVAAAYVANTMLTVPNAPDPRWTWMGELAKAVA